MKLNINNVELYYKKSGQGLPLILLHGNGEDHHIFDPLASKLSREFTVYAIDSRNHGQSSKTDDYAYETMANDIGLFIQALGLAKVNIVGFSDGAIISLLLAIKSSQLINKMALLGVNLKPEDFTEESYKFVKETYEATKDPLFKLMLEQPNIELEQLKQVRVPTLLIAGEHDIYRADLFDEIAATMPDASQKIMAGHSHDSYIVNQDLLYPDLCAFLLTRE